MIPEHFTPCLMPELINPLPSMSSRQGFHLPTSGIPKLMFAVMVWIYWPAFGGNPVWDEFSLAGGFGALEDGPCRPWNDSGEANSDAAVLPNDR